MGSRLNLALAFGALAGLVIVPSLADAQRYRHPKARPPAAKKEAPPPALTTPNITLSGEYALTRLMGRPVRDPDLALARITFGPRFSVTGTTACNGFQGRLHRDPSGPRIVGFDDVVATEMGCPTKKMQAERTILNLLRDTINIARAGNSISLFNANGVPIAQFSAVSTNSEAAPETPAPPRGAPAPTRVQTGDYVLSELGGVPVAVRAPPSAVPQPVYAANTRFVPILPTMYLRENSAVSGLAGCNQYNSTLVRESAGVNRLAPAATTKKACLDRATGRMERDLLSAFREASRVDVNPSRINLYRANGSRLARFNNVAARAGTGPSLFGNTWVLRSINGAAVRTSPAPSLVFEGNQAIGNTGCNQFNMIHERRNGRSRFQDGAMTRAACPDRARSELEQQFLSSLTTITTLNLTATQLTMRSTDGATTMMFEVD